MNTSNTQNCTNPPSQRAGSEESDQSIISYKDEIIMSLALGTIAGMTTLFLDLSLTGSAIVFASSTVYTGLKSFEFFLGNSDQTGNQPTTESENAIDNPQEKV